MERLVQSVVQDAPEAPMMTVRDILAWAVVRLCDDGNAWVIEGEPVVVAADTPYAEIEAPAGAEPVRVLQIVASGAVLTPGVDYRQTSPSGIQLMRKVGVSTLSGRLAVMPSPGGQMPAELLATHAETLRFGALSRLLLMPQPWRNTELALHYQKLWTAGVNNANRLAMYGHHAGGARVAPRRFM